MAHEIVQLRTPDGVCPTHVFTGESGRRGPAVLFYLDAGGVRPGAAAMAERLAAAGYVVAAPDPFYRYGPYGPFDPKVLFKGDVRAVLGPLMATTGPAKAAEDVGALIATLDARGDVEGRRIGAVGFCMGGGMALAAAAARPDRIVATASFHGGRLATDAEDSPHLGAPRLSGEVYIAAASDDPSYPPEMAERFEAALRAADVRFRSETYPAAHGWMKPDFPVYDEAQAERGWVAMLDLFGRTLKAPAAG